MEQMARASLRLVLNPSGNKCGEGSDIPFNNLSSDEKVKGHMNQILEREPEKACPNADYDGTDKRC